MTDLTKTQKLFFLYCLLICCKRNESWTRWTSTSMSKKGFLFKKEGKRQKYLTWIDDQDKVRTTKFQETDVGSKKKPECVTIYSVWTNVTKFWFFKTFSFLFLSKNVIFTFISLIMNMVEHETNFSLELSNKNLSVNKNYFFMKNNWNCQIVGDFFAQKKIKKFIKSCKKRRSMIRQEKILQSNMLSFSWAMSWNQKYKIYY